MKNKIKSICISSVVAVVVGMTFYTTSVANADEYKASLAQMPVYAISDKEGVAVDLVKAMEKVSGNQIFIKVQPFKRSMNDVINSKVDFHIPLIKNDILVEDKLPYYYSSETILHVNFTLYTKKGSGITKDNLYQYKVETDAAHVEYFPFKIIESYGIDQSLKKLSSGRIDAYVFADIVTDPLLKELGLKNIQRQLYKRFDVKIVLPKTERGKQVDKMLSEAIQKLRETGEFQRIISTIDIPYDDWQL